MGFEHVSEVFSLKYSLEVLDLLSESGELRFSELEDEVPASSDVLSRTLRTLCQYGLVERHESNPRYVRYSIANVGKEFLQLGQRLEDLLE